MIPLPIAVADYLAADKAKDADGVAACFTADARVDDEARTYVGRAAIALWKRDTTDKYQYDVEPIEAAAHGASVTVRARLSGNFPNSPLELDYTFTLTGDKISQLTID
jgi:hypothetical protein